MAKAYYHNLPTVLCKILGIYTVRYDNKETGKKTSENVVVMENIFYQVRSKYLMLLLEKFLNTSDFVEEHNKDL